MGTENYTLGKGSVFFSQIKDDGITYEDERDLGNCPEFSFSISLEKLEHYSSQAGLRAKDMEVISKISPSVSFTLDELSAENLALLTLSDVATDVDQTAGTILETADALVVTDGKLDLDKKEIADLILYEDDGTTVIPTASYSLDAQSGIVTFIDTFTETSVKVSCSFPTTKYKVLNAIKQTTIEGRMRFISANSTGKDQILQIHRVSLTPSGDTAMIGDDWSSLSFSGEILKSGLSEYATSPYFNLLIKE